MNSESGGPGNDLGPESTARRILRNSIWHSFGWGFMILLNFFSVPFIISELGPSSYGIFVLAISIAAPMGLLDFGMTDATVKYLSESLGKDDRAGAARYAASGMFFNIAVGIVGTGLVVAIAPFLVRSVFDIPLIDHDEAIGAMRLSAILWMAAQIRQTPTGVMTAFKRFDLLNVGSSLMQAVILLCGLAALWSGGGLTGFVGAQAGASVAATGVWIALSMKVSGGISLIPAFERASLRQTTTFGFWQMLNMLGSILSQQSLRWLLGILLNVTSIGFYNVCQQLVNTLYMIAYRIGQVLFPEVSALVGKGAGKKAAEIVVHATWLVSVAAGAMFVPVAIFAQDLLRLWVGGEISNVAAETLRIMCIGSFIGCLFAAPSFYLLGTERGRWLAGMSMMNGAIVVVASALLVPPLGLSGAAIAYAGGTLVHAVILIAMWRTVFRAWIPGRSYFSAAFGGLFLSTILGGAGSLARNAWMGPSSWGELTLWGGAAAAVTAFCILSIGHFLPGGSDRTRSVLSLVRSIRSTKSVEASE